MSSGAKKWLKRGLVVLAAVFLLLAGALVFLHEGRPALTPGDAADARARALQAAVNLDAWAQTRAARWTFGGRNTHLWDRDRKLIRVRWDDFEVQRHVDGPGKAWRAGREVTDTVVREELLAAAHAHFINDSFWLNPFASLFDGGVLRGLATNADGREGLMVQYATGGLTPGDAYLWLGQPDARPEAWQMWVGLLPIGGVPTTWEGWTQLRTGAWISTAHTMGPIDLMLTDVDGAATLAELEPGPDPFAAIIE